MRLRSIADDIYQHQTNAAEMEKITLSEPALTVNDAYEIQRLCIERYLQAGDALAGWKMGLTSKAKQQSVGVNEPIYGRLLRSMELRDPELRVEGLIHPRVEPEIAFVIKRRLEGPHVTARDIWAATDVLVHRPPRQLLRRGRDLYTHPMPQLC